MEDDRKAARRLGGGGEVDKDDEACIGEEVVSLRRSISRWTRRGLKSYKRTLALKSAGSEGSRRVLVEVT